jgi:hypothetical protein
MSKTFTLWDKSVLIAVEFLYQVLLQLRQLANRDVPFPLTEMILQSPN